MTYAIYRILYGSDFIQESINSITDYVDKIFIFYDVQPWCEIKGYTYKGEYRKYPKQFDDVLSKIRQLRNNKIILEYDHVHNCMNQATHLFNNKILLRHKKPNTFIFLEADCVFRKDQIENAIKEFKDKKLINAHTRQVEVWKYKWRVPERTYRSGVVFWNMKNLSRLPLTKRGAESRDRTIKMCQLSSYIHNMGFSMSDSLMWTKHSIALGLQGKLGDMKHGINENWYEEKWLKWTPKMKNLEMAKGKEHLIPKVIPYDVNELPEEIKKKVT